ncbi:endonuclease/exonuclease/phosphatase family protein [Altererythrobacter aquiaggeris]|uniref:endonuclease/exonuclease/phosphatase family protein n=1 Tax=Aestuarierythrobacter aquiaggeris TaxID=1898396 RepID=UPI00301ADBF2
MDLAPMGKWKLAGRWLLRLVAIILIAGTLLSTTDLNQWWIRIWDFPRVQILIAMVVTAMALWFLDRGWRPWFPLVLAGLTIWQLYRVYPYTPVAAEEVALVQAGESNEAACFTILTLNVLQKNREYQRTADLIRRTNPDVLLLTETDQPWADAMGPVLQPYANQIHRPLDNTYGIMFATRLPMKDATIQDMAQKDTPSVFATLMAGKREFRMIGLHPRPPTVNQDTEERDAEIIVAAKQSRDIEMPVLALGDFNDVAWSDTTSLFKTIGSFLDPRVGRGTYATFPADMTWLGWPLDHLFVTEEFLLRDMSVGEPVGSDHLPVLAELCLAPVPARQRNQQTEAPSSEDEEEAGEVLKEFKKDEAEDRIEGEAG